jgi:hypothetical protein
MVDTGMAAQSGSDIRRHVLARVAFFCGERDQLEDRSMSELFPDPWDFVELRHDLEETYGLDLRPFFEDGQPERGWGPWRRKIARDVTVAELAGHVERVVSHRS